MKKLLIAPSILSADFSILKDEIKKIEDAGADMVHVDVMDGHFVPNITVGVLVVEAARRCTRILLDVHLMIENPHKFIKDFAEAGSDIITIHAEEYPGIQSHKVTGSPGHQATEMLRKGQSRTTKDIDAKRIKEVLGQIKSFGIKAGISLNPDTPFCIKEILDDIDMILFMSVHPGFGGQKFMESILPKIREARKYFDRDIQVDGGINEETAKYVIEAGANVLVAGSYFFNSKEPKNAVIKLKGGK